MKLSQKKNCVNCWALGDNLYCYCDLGVLVDIATDDGCVVTYPVKPCYKPKTKKQFERAQKLMENM